MKLNEREMESLLYVRNECKGTKDSRDIEVCIKCPYYEGYCHFTHFLHSQLEEEEE